MLENWIKPQIPELVVVDELAHTNVEGCRNKKRWQDVMELLDAGINVVSVPLLHQVMKWNTSCTQSLIHFPALSAAAAIQSYHVLKILKDYGYRSLHKRQDKVLISKCKHN